MSASSLYLNDPIALVLVEVRHPAAEPLAGDSITALKQALGATTPLYRPEQEVVVDPGTGKQTESTVHKLVSRELQTAITFGSRAISIESTNYPGWERFRSIVEAALTARQEISPVDGIERVGLRYIDEVRVPGNSPVNWQEWVAPSLLGPSNQLASLGLQPQLQQGIIQYQTSSPNELFALRYGAGRGAFVPSSPNLRRKFEPKPEDEYFLIDTDGSWSDPGEIPSLEIDFVLAKLDRLHHPMKSLFEKLITQKLREEVLDGPR